MGEAYNEAVGKLAQATAAICEEIDLLLQWADQSQTGGWSTHQVKPQMDRAAALALLLHRLES